jgi:hypothetical protein
MDSLSLLQAVRSYLHFSQLSAWYSKVSIIYLSCSYPNNPRSVYFVRDLNM